MDLYNKYIFDGLFGLERETLRVTRDGRLSRAPHPFDGDPNLDRDFCENQLELITSPCPDIEALMAELARLDRRARDGLAGRGEYLWLCSNPPHIESENDIPIALYTGSQSFKHDYRIKLERRYGKRLMLYSGIHFNFSFSEKLIESAFDNSVPYKDHKSALYFRLSKQLSRYSWLLVLLTAASPVYDRSLDTDGLSGSAFDGYASRRSGDEGYWNQFIPILDYTDLSAYVNSVNDYVTKGALFSSSELYLPIRLKAAGSNSLDSLVAEGVNHIELRMFDLNPLAPLGVFADDLYFAHYFMIYLTLLPDFAFTPELQKTAVRNHRAAARYELDTFTINGYPAREAALGLLDDMREYFIGFPEVVASVDKQKAKLTDGNRYCERVYNKLIDDFQSDMMRIATEGTDMNV